MQEKNIDDIIGFVYVVSPYGTTSTKF